MRATRDKTALGAELRSRLIQVSQLLFAYPKHGIELTRDDSSIPLELRDCIAEVFSVLQPADAIEHMSESKSPLIREAGGVLGWVWRYSSRAHIQ